jgi:hypothetical protein
MMTDAMRVGIQWQELDGRFEDVAAAVRIPPRRTTWISVMRVAAAPERSANFEDWLGPEKAPAERRRRQLCWRWPQWSVFTAGNLASRSHERQGAGQSAEDYAAEQLVQLEK